MLILSYANFFYPHQTASCMTTESLLICNEQEKRRINIYSILYIITEDYLSTFHLSNNQKFTCSKSLTEIAACLPDCFLQISRGCMVNLNHVHTIMLCNRQIILNDSTQLEVSVRRIKELNNALAKQNITFTR